MPSSFITSFANKDSNFIYPTMYVGTFTALKTNQLNTYAVTDFNVNLPSLVMQTTTSATSFANAWQTTATAVNNWINVVGPANICVKFLGVVAHSQSATSHTCTILFIVNRL
jgi:hypothetical protein